MTSFEDIVSSVSDIGKKWHEKQIVKNNLDNKGFIAKSIKDLPKQDRTDGGRAIVISAGPSLHQGDALEKLSEVDFDGKIIAIDGSYIKCLKAGVIPDYLLTLDPHPSRIVRWFGDPEFEEHSKHDDYFSRQDLNLDFRKNSIIQNIENIELVNKYAYRTKLIIASTAPKNVVQRALEAKFDLFWWLPLVDDPECENSITKKMYSVSKIPAMNTGGNVGTAAWIFAKFWLNIDKVAVLGMDLGYRSDLPYEMTQTYYELISSFGKQNIDKYFPKFINPLTEEEFYTDPTYYWYRENLLDILSNSGKTLYNCTEGGILFGENVICMKFDDFLRS